MNTRPQLLKTDGDDITISVSNAALKGDLTIPPDALGLVIFAHGSGSSRRSPRNQSVAQFLQEGRMATLLFDLLTFEEEQIDQYTGHLRFDITMLANRLVEVANWANQYDSVRQLPFGYFGSSTGAAAALVAAAQLGDRINAVVSRGGRPDLAGKSLSEVLGATLLIVGTNDVPVIALNERALESLQCEKSIVLVPHATHLFEEPGTLERVSELALAWFKDHFVERVQKKSGRNVRS